MGGDSKASELERDRECVSIEGDVVQNKQTAVCVCRHFFSRSYTNGSIFRFNQTTCQHQLVARNVYFMYNKHLVLLLLE